MQIPPVNLGRDIVNRALEANRWQAIQGGNAQAEVVMRSVPQATAQSKGMYRYALYNGDQSFMHLLSH